MRSSVGRALIVTENLLFRNTRKDAKSLRNIGSFEISKTMCNLIVADMISTQNHNDLHSKILIQTDNI